MTLLLESVQHLSLHTMLDFAASQHEVKHLKIKSRMTTPKHSLIAPDKRDLNLNMSNLNEVQVLRILICLRFIRFGQKSLPCKLPFLGIFVY